MERICYHPCVCLHGEGEYGEGDGDDGEGVEGHTVNVRTYSSYSYLYTILCRSE